MSANTRTKAWEAELSDEDDNSETDEATDLTELLSLFDSRGYSTIECGQLGTVLRALGHLPTEEELSRIIAASPTDRFGMLSFATVRSIAKQQSQLRRHRRRRQQRLVRASSCEELAEALGSLEGSCRGNQTNETVSLRLLRQLLTSRGEALTDSEVRDLLREFAADGSDEVECQRLAEFMCIQRT